ncbi:MAG: recombinase RecA, partial [Planctomycetales bacterium]|nr:recombinase RecA [Planctomycetales bacterium]
MNQRLSTGLTVLDEALGGGLLPGSLTMIIGATGVGKTQLGMHILHAGSQQTPHNGGRNGGSPGAIIDLSSRGDSQNHTGYARSMFQHPLSVVDVNQDSLACPFVRGRPEDIYPFLGYGGRRVLRSQMDVDQWHAWQSELKI